MSQTLKEVGSKIQHLILPFKNMLQCCENNAHILAALTCPTFNSCGNLHIERGKFQKYQKA